MSAAVAGNGNSVVNKMEKGLYFYFTEGGWGENINKKTNKKISGVECYEKYTKDCDSHGLMDRAATRRPKKTSPKG